MLRKTTICIWILASAPTLFSGSALRAESEKKTCPAAREYITALEFMRAREDLAVRDQAAQELARRVSEGCEGAAKRFISTTLLLREAEVNSSEAMEFGLEFARRSDAEAATFSTVFKRAFVEEYLDLDLRSSLKMAKELSTELKTDQASVRKDFESLVDLCTRSRKLDLPRPQCGAFAMRITKKGEPWAAAGAGGAAKHFQTALNFLTSETGPSLTTGDALRIAEELISEGPGSIENFTLAYRYAASEKGMNAPREQALAFARKMAARKSPVQSEEKR